MYVHTSRQKSISMVFWLLAREVLILRGELDKDEDDWNEVLVDLFYYKKIVNKTDEEKKEEGENPEDADQEEDGEGIEDNENNFEEDFEGENN